MVKFISYKIKISALALGLIFFWTITTAQSLEKAKLLWQNQELPAAAEQIDGYTNTNANDIDGWLLKAKIYAAIGNDEQLKYSFADGRMQAHQALTKAIKINRDLVTKTLKEDNFQLPLSIYDGYIKSGVAIFNSGTETQNKETYAEAYETFKKAALVADDIYSNDWGLSKLDTTAIFFMARSALQSGKNDAAILNIRRLEDAEVLESSKINTFSGLYKWLVYYYNYTNDAVQLRKYTDLNIRLFPQEQYFSKNYIDWLRKQNEFSNLFAAYENMFTRGFNDQENQYLYATDIFNYLYPEHETDSAAQTKFYMTIENYIRINPDSAKGKLLYAKFLVNQAAFLQKWLKFSDKMSAKMLAVCNMRISLILNTANKQLMPIVNGSKKIEKNIYNEAVGLLVSNFTAMKQQVQAKKYKTLYR